MERKTYYRCQWRRSHMGVIVELSSEQHDERPAGWFDTQEKARKAEARNMQALASDLWRQAEHLTRDSRGS